jgi:hypothetical protein
MSPPNIVNDDINISMGMDFYL